MNPAGLFFYLSILLLVLFLVGPIILLIGRLLNRKVERIEGIVLTRWTSHRSRVLNPAHPDNFLKKSFPQKNHTYGYETAGVRFDSVMDKTLNSCEQIVAAFPVKSKITSRLFYLGGPARCFSFQFCFCHEPRPHYLAPSNA